MNKQLNNLIYQSKLFQRIIGEKKNGKTNQRQTKDNSTVL